MELNLLFLFLFTLPHISFTNTINLSFQNETPINTHLINVTQYVADGSNLKIVSKNDIFLLKNDSLYLSQNFTQQNYQILLTYQTRFSLAYIIFNISVEFGREIFYKSGRGLVPVHAPPFSIVSGLTSAYFECQYGSICFDSSSLSCVNASCPFGLELLTFGLRYYISVYTTEKLINVTCWYLQIHIRNQGQDDFILELIIETFEDIFYPIFKKLDILYFSESTAIGTFLFKPELHNPLSNHSYLFSLQSNLAANYLNLDSQTGEIYLRSEFDAEFHSTILVTIEVRFIHNITVTVIQSISTANFLINIIDVSEFAPIFSFPIYECIICTDTSANQFLAFTPVWDNDVTNNPVMLYIEQDFDQSILFELQHETIWTGTYNGSNVKVGTAQNFRLTAVDFYEKTLFSESELKVRFLKCSTPDFFQNSVVVKFSPVCPFIYKIPVYFSDINKQKNDKYELQLSNLENCKIEPENILICSNLSQIKNLSLNIYDSNLDVIFQEEDENIHTFIYPIIHPQIDILMLTPLVDMNIFNFGNFSKYPQFRISGIFDQNFPIFIENSSLKISKNPFPGEYIFEVIASNISYSIPYMVMSFQVEIISAFQVENISLKFPFLEFNSSIYTFVTEFGAFKYELLNTSEIPFALDYHQDNIITTFAVGNISRFNFEVLAVSLKNENLTQKLIFDISFDPEFEDLSFLVPKSIFINLPKYSGYEILDLGHDKTNLSLKIMGENTIFTVSNTKILLQNGTYFSQQNLTLLLQIEIFNNSIFTSKTLHNIKIIFLNSTFLSQTNPPISLHIALPFCLQNNSHIFKLPQLPSGEYKLNSSLLQISANGSLIYTGATYAYTQINQSIFIFHNSQNYLFSIITINFIGQDNDISVHFGVKNGTQIGIKIGRLWNHTIEACTFFMTPQNVPFYIDSMSGDIFVSSILKENWYQFKVEQKYFCLNRIFEVSINISSAKIFKNETYHLTFQRTESHKFVGYLATEHSNEYELSISQNSSIYTSYFYLQNNNLFTKGFPHKLQSLMLIVEICIPETKSCNYAYIQLTITPSNYFAPKFSHKSLNIYIPSSQQLNSQIFKLTAYDSDGIFDQSIFSLFSNFINTTETGDLFIIATPVEGNYVINPRVTDLSGYQSELSVCIWIYEQFNQSKLFQEMYFNISIDPVLNPEFQLTPSVAGAYEYILLFTTPPYSLSVNNSGYLSIQHTQTIIQTIILIFSEDLAIFGTSNLQINILDLQHPPTFPAQFVTINIFTNASVGDEFMTQQAIDLEQSEVLIYSIESYTQGVPQIFSFNSTHLILTQNLTEFQFRYINITIRATNSIGLFTEFILLINIIPAVQIKFQNDFEIFNISLPNTMPLFKVVPLGSLEGVEISITHISPSEDFYIDTEGYIYTIVTPQYHFKYELLIEAKLRLSIDSIKIVINVDFIFEFDSNVFMTILPEDTGTNTFIYQPQIHSIPLEVVYRFDTFVTEFQVNSTGHINLISHLDYETTQTYNLTLLAFSHFLQKTISLNFMITVTDINDNSPFFIGQTPFFAYIFSHEVSTNIYQFQAGDFDSNQNGEISFVIEQTSVANIFQISNNGLLYFEQFPDIFLNSYSIVLVAFDKGSPSLTTTTIITINVISSYTNNIPIFEHDLYEIEIAENLDNFESPLLYTRAFSPYPIDYEIVSNPTGLQISIEATTQNIFISESLDFENTSRYDISILANDTNSSSVCLFVVYVLDVNDNTPLFDKQIYKLYLVENNKVGDLVHTFNISDLDSGTNGETYLYFTEENDFSYFEIIQNALVVKIEFDFEEIPFLEFEVIVSDRGTPRKSSSCFVIVYIVNINDNIPVVAIGTNVVNLPENSTENTEIFSIPANDEDNLNPLIFTLQNDLTYFGIYVDNNVGILFLVTSPLRGTYQLNITISDQSNFVFVTIYVLVGKVNENPPVIDQSTCEGSLMENAPNNTFVTQITASDGDIGQNGEYIFSILTNLDIVSEIDSTVFENVFKIDSKTGIIQLNYNGELLVGEKRTLIDAEFNSVINIDVIVSDGGGRQDFCRVAISILDENDNAPNFDRDLYEVTFKQIIGEMNILIVFAFDPDQGDNGKIRYARSGNFEFKIDSETGVISSHSSITSGNYTLTIHAYDFGYPVLESTSTVFISVEQDLPPRAFFPSLNYSVSVPENYSLNTAFIQLEAIPTAENSQIIYSISRGRRFRTNQDETFQIDGITGEISLALHLDYEILRPGPFLFSLLVVASNFEIPSYTQCFVTVLDVNDNTPIFSSHILKFSTDEGAENGTIVGRLVATDMDSGVNGEVEYFVYDTTLEIPFIVQLDGYMVTTKVFDYEDTTEPNIFSFLAVARDKCGLECSLTRAVSVAIRINDLNDNSPVFQRDLPNVIRIREDIVPPESIVTFQAIDIDTISIDVLEYSILKGNIQNTFLINFKNGHLSLVKSLDFESRIDYNLSIQVCDGFYCVRKDVVVVVVDVDDVIPLFTRAIYEIEIPESVPIGMLVAKVEANDADLPENGTIMYEISSQSIAADYFEINVTTGEIRTISQLDREEYSFFEFFCFALDSNQNRGKTIVLVLVTDINEPPYFPKSFYKVFIPENKPFDTFVSRFQAIDRDNGDNSTLIYELFQDVNNAFYVNNQTGDLYTQQIFDYEFENVYVVVLKVFDHGSPPLSTQTTIEITIEDVNDHFPGFICPQMFSRIYKNVKNNSVVTKIRIWDGDKVPVFHLQLLTPGVPFVVSGLTGEVIFSGNLTENFYSLEVVLKDFSLNFTEFGNFSITVLPTNRNPPVFTSSTNQFTVFVGTEIGTEIGQISAEDSEEGKLAFFINDTNFRIDVYTGTITLNMEPNVQAEYYLNVTVIDHGFPQLSNFTLIRISIKKSSEIVIIFSENFYTIQLEENKIFENILQIQILNNFPVTFRIEDDMDTFSIDTYSGNLSLVTTLDHEFKSLYNITIVTEDEDGMLGSTYVVIRVVDVNDNPSRDTFSTIFIRKFESQNEIFSITFDDPDSNDRFQDCSYENGSMEFKIFSECNIGVNVSESGVYEVVISGTDGIHDKVNNHITIDIHILQYLAPKNIFSLLFANSSQEILRNISNLQNQIHTFFPPNIILYSIEEHISGAKIYFYSNQDIQLVLYSIYQTRNSFQQLGYQVESISNEPCDSEPCLNQGLCNNSLSFGPIKSFSSQQITFISPQIQHSFHCICAPGSAGKICDINIDDCLGVICQNGAKCVDLLQDFYCECPVGVTGKFCENSVDNCVTNPCNNFGECVNTISHFECHCLEGFYGETCQFSLTEMADLCVTVRCENNATCTASMYESTCTCSDGFIGQTCANKSEVAMPCDSNPCQYGGECVPSQTDTIGYYCVCPLGYIGPDCCYPMNACETHPCKNGGTCLSGFYGDYICLCPSSRSGTNCDIFLSPCDVSPCQNGGVCTEVGYEYICDCPIRFVGDNCQYQTFPPNFCISNNCQNGAICSSGFESYTCSCQNGFSGSFCQSATPPSDPCGANPCRHEGKCVGNATHFECECIYGFSGQFCENNINDCENVSCTFGACIDGLGGHRCECQNGFSGDDCAIECPIGTSGTNCNELSLFCSESSCHTGHNCSELIGGFECHCPDGFGGTNCAIRLSCDNIECENGGNCVNHDLYGFECGCPPEYWGAKCELLRSTSFNSQSFIRFPGSILPNQNAALDFKLRTAANNGLILFGTNFRDFVYKDFIIVDISHSIVRLTVSFGGDNYVLHDCDSTPLSDTIWHNISISYSVNAISICVDLCRQMCQLEIDNSFHSLDGIISLLLGGMPFDQNLKIAQNFTGCLQDFHINKQPIDLSDGFHFQTVETCDTILSPCEGVKCPSRSYCVETSSGAMCTCNRGYSGAFCEEIVQSITLESGAYLRVVPINRMRRDLSSLSLALNSFSIAILPNAKFGTILNITDSIHYLKLELTDTHLELITETNSIAISIGNTSNPWFQISFRIVKNILTLNSNDQTAELELNSILTLNGPFSSIYISSADLGLQGCIQDIRLNEYQLQETNPAFQLVKFPPEQNSDATSGCQVACDNSICGFGTCVPLFTELTGYICECLDDTFQTICLDNESTPLVTIISILIAVTLIVIVVILTLILVVFFFTHKHFENVRRYSVQVYENDQRSVGKIRRYTFQGGGQTKADPEPSILSDELLDTKLDENLMRSIILRREAYLCDDDSKRCYSDSEGEEMLTNSLSRPSELNIDELVPIETLDELGSPFKQLRSVLYNGVEDQD